MGVETGEASTAPVTPSKPKRSLFSKKTQAKPPEPPQGGDSIAFFSRANDFFPQQRAELERRKQKKAEKLERKRIFTSADRKEDDPPLEKKRRIANRGELYSSDEDAGEISRTRKGSTLSTLGSDVSPSSSKRPTQQTSSTSLSTRYEKELEAQILEKQKTVSVMITLTDSDDDYNNSKPLSAVQVISLDDEKINSAPPIKSQAARDDLQLSDEEFPELIQQAKERQRQKELRLQNATQSFQRQNHVNSNLSDDDIFQDPSAIQEDPIMEIFITSQIEGTTPILVKRKMFGTLGLVRQSWCFKQIIEGKPMTEEVKNNIFLSWRGIKLYDVTTCASLGLKTDITGKLTTPGQDGVDENGRVHLEAWTQDLFEIFQKKMMTTQDESNEEEIVTEEVVVPRVKLILKSRDFDDFKLKLKPTITVENMTKNFRYANNIPDNKEITLHFDGEKLDPKARVEDMDFEDLDTIEVIVR